MSFVSAVINSQILTMTFTTSGSMKCLRMGAVFSFIVFSEDTTASVCVNLLPLPQNSSHFIRHSRCERKCMIALMKWLHQGTESPEPFSTCVVLMEKYADVAYSAGTPASETHLTAFDSEHFSSILGRGLLVRAPATYFSTSDAQ